MKLLYRPTILAIVILLTFYINSCNSRTKKHTARIVIDSISSIPKSNYELANEFLNKLKNDKVDTIVFYKRTCIGCCDFFNIFWTSDGHKFLKKIHTSYAFKNLYPDVIHLNDSKIFNELHNHYSDLKNTRIKPNQHELKNGDVQMTLVDHYCYTKISIFTLQDSIESNGIKDSDFDKYIRTSFDPNEKFETNDNYLTNINSKWNLFLNVIEQQLSGMAETPNREQETLRSIKKDK